MNCGISLKIRPFLSMAQQVMKLGLTICQCKELVLFPLLLCLLGFFIYLGFTSVSRVTCLRLQDLPPGSTHAGASWDTGP